MAAPRRLAVAATLVVAAAAAVFLFARADEASPRLDALKADPLGRHAPAGGRLALESETPEGETLGKPRAARYARWFALTGDPQAALDGAVRAAESAGWRIEDAPGDPTSVVGSKQIDGGPASAVLALHTERAFLPPDVAAPALAITLDR